MLIFIISGFLGAGKTTFILELVKILEGKIAILENEFGEVDIDSSVLRENELTVTELKNGCVCCSMKGDFKEAVLKIYEEVKPDNLIIEPTGVGSLSSILDILKPIIKDNIELVAPITMVDSLDFEDYIEVFGDFYRDQIKYASTLILTKGESEKELDKIKDLLREINPSAEIIVSNDNEYSVDEWNDILNRRYDFSKELASYVEDASIMGLSTRSTNMLLSFSRPTWENWLKKLKSGSFGKVIRGKGFVEIDGVLKRFDYVNGKNSLVDFKGEAGGLCLIGKDLKDFGKGV
ncbi:MAG: GTP-binding protein [Tissierellia bacterium]|nr:GTP-binding protein [Tissierellia bacterium]